MPSVMLEHAGARPGRPEVDLLDALPHEFYGLYWDTDRFREIEGPEGLDALGATEAAHSTVRRLFDEVVGDAHEIWIARVECVLSSGAESLLVLMGICHSSDRWGQSASSVGSYVVRDLDGRVLFELSSTNDEYGVFWLGEPTVERGDGACELALAGVLLFAPDDMFYAWDGLPGQRGMEWLGRVLESEALCVEGRPLDPALEPWREA